MFLEFRLKKSGASKRDWVVPKFETYFVEGRVFLCVSAVADMHRVRFCGTNIIVGQERTDR